jgi:peptidase A4-like protein
MKRILASTLAIVSLTTAAQAASVTRGLPPPPAVPFDSDAYRTWQRAVQAARTPLAIDFVQSGELQPHRVVQPDWAGPVLFAPGERSMHVPAYRFGAIEGEWTVPFAKPTINCSKRAEPTDGSSLWIGLDGWSGTFWAHYRKDGTWYRYKSTDVLQAGTESDVACYGGPNRSYPTHAYFWIEWAGTKNIAVTHDRRDLVLKAGDVIYTRIAVDTSGSAAWQRATVWLVDETTGYYLPARTFRSGCVDCGTPYERPATLFGNTAEWVTEATFYDANAPRLPNTLNDFGRVTVHDALATDQFGNAYGPGAPGAARPNIDWMTWQGTPLSEGGTLWACSTITGPTTASYARAPYVVATPGQQGDLEPKPKHC